MVCHLSAFFDDVKNENNIIFGFSKYVAEIVVVIVKNEIDLCNCDIS